MQASLFSITLLPASGVCLLWQPSSIGILTVLQPPESGLNTAFAVYYNQLLSQIDKNHQFLQTPLRQSVGETFKMCHGVILNMYKLDRKSVPVTGNAQESINIYQVPYIPIPSCT